jgi:hypothetical protein
VKKVMSSSTLVAEQGKGVGDGCGGGVCVCGVCVWGGGAS